LRIGRAAPNNAGVTVTQLDPADSGAMAKWYDLVVAVVGHDLPDFPVPSRQAHVARFDHPWPTLTEEAHLAWDGDRVVGAASYFLPQAENVGTLHLELVVHPEHRRRGIGTALLEEVYAAARRHHRSLIEIMTVHTLPGGVARDAAGHRYLTNRAHKPGLTSEIGRAHV